MFSKNIKISRGLSKLISGRHADHFRLHSDIFLDHPKYRSNYFEMFKKAQVVEIANSNR